MAVAVWVNAPKDVNPMPTSTTSPANAGSSPTGSWYRAFRQQSFKLPNERWVRAGKLDEGTVEGWPLGWAIAH